jgi:hypothetical protein
MRLPLVPAARQAAVRLAAVALALAAASGCTSSDPPAAPTRPAERAVGAAAASSPAAELQAGLTALLVERAYVVSAATDAVATAAGRLTEPTPASALDALDANSTALADVLGATYSTARAPLLQALRRDDRLLAQHAVALAEGDPAAATAVRRQLVQVNADLARVVRQVVPALDAGEVAERFRADVEVQLAPRSYDRLHTVAQGAAGTARLLASGIAADRGLGSPGTEAGLLRAELTGLLTEHVMLVGALARERRTPGPGAMAARDALQVNADALADVLGKALPAARAAFLRSWTAHLARLDRYAAARAAGGTAAAEAGLVRGYPAELARLLAEHVRALPAQSSSTELEPALASLLVAVDAAAAGDPQAPAALRQAGGDVLPAAALVSAAMAEDLRLR